VLFLLLLPVGHDLAARFQRFRNVEPGIYEAGFTMHPVGPADDALYEHIRNHTESQAVCIDDDPNLPVLGWRALYVAGPLPARQINGWYYTNEEWLHLIHGYSQERIAERLRVVRGLYQGPASLSDAAILAALSPLARERPIYVIAHHRTQADQLALRSFLRPVAQGEGWAIFRYDPERGAVGAPAANEGSHESGRH
jgi:hypothetical protein